MPVRIYTTESGSELGAAELGLLRDSVAKTGRLTLLAPSFGMRDLCRHGLADAGLGLGIDVATPDTWVRGLWELLGDGRREVTPFERQLILSDMLSRRDASELKPLTGGMGTVRMLANMARDLLPGAVGTDVAASPSSDAEGRVLELLGAYAGELDRRGLVEPCEAVEILQGQMADPLPAMLRAVCVRGVTAFPASLVRLLAAVSNAGGAVDILLSREGRTMREGLADAFGALGCELACAPLDPAAEGVAPGLPRFLEVEGPHARARAYTEGIVRLADEMRPDVPSGRPSVLVVAPDPAALFDDAAPRLADAGIAARVTASVSFAQASCGRAFASLADLAARMEAAEAGDAAKTEWWPAPELSDWIANPVSGGDVFRARTFDKNMRLSRAKTVDGVMNLLQSVQGQVNSGRKKLEDDSLYKKVPCAVHDVLQAIRRNKPVTALKAMLSAVEAAPDRSFGGRDGQVRRQAELQLIQRAIEVLTVDARELDVSQAAAVPVLDGIRVTVNAASRVYEPADGGDEGAWVLKEPWAEARFMTLAQAAEVKRDAFDAAFFADVDGTCYSLKHREGPADTLAAELCRVPVELEPAARQNVLFGQAMEAAAGPVAFARVTHDRQAKACYPAAVWTRLLARAEASRALAFDSVGEGEVDRDFDPAGCRGMERAVVACEAPQHLSEGAIPYLVLRHRDGEGPDAPLVPRLTSASQIEAYSDCPLCWFVSYRVKPQGIDAGFGNMEKGNFVHDVLEHLHRQLMENGMGRVTQQNLGRAQALLREVFDKTLAEHAAKRGTEGPLVPISPVERHQVAEILPQLEAVLAYEAEALAPFAPQYLEYSFNDKGVVYAGWPLGGRIDRIDVDAEMRAVVIDYKHRSLVNEFKLKDPTVPDKAGEVAADDPRWLPPHTQSLIYAQAVRRALGLDSRAALYFSTKSSAPALRGAASAELIEVEKGDGRIPGLKDGFPAEDGSMTFDALLDRVEAGIAERLGELEAGVVAAREDPGSRCGFNHRDAFMRRDA